MPPAIDHNEQCIATLRRDVALWRELAKLAVHRLADALRENEALRRRPAVMMETEPSEVESDAQAETVRPVRG